MPKLPDIDGAAMTLDAYYRNMTCEEKGQKLVHDAGWMEFTAGRVRESEKTFIQLIKSGASLKECDKDGNTALHWFSLRGAEKVGHCADALIAAGAPLDALNKEDRSPLVTAVHYGHQDMVTRLIKAGAKLDGALFFIARFHMHQEFADELLKAGADPNERDDTGKTLLMWAADDVKSGLLRSLIRAGAELDARDNAGNTALMHAAPHLYGAQMMLELMRAGADYKISNGDGKTALDILKENSFSKEEDIKQIQELIAERVKKQCMAGLSRNMPASKPLSFKPKFKL